MCDAAHPRSSRLAVPRARNRPDAARARPREMHPLNGLPLPAINPMPSCEPCRLGLMPWGRGGDRWADSWRPALIGLWAGDRRRSRAQPGADRNVPHPEGIPAHPIPSQRGGAGPIAVDAAGRGIDSIECLAELAIAKLALALALIQWLQAPDRNYWLSQLTQHGPPQRQPAGCARARNKLCDCSLSSISLCPSPPSVHPAPAPAPAQFLWLRLGFSHTLSTQHGQPRHHRACCRELCWC